MMSTVLTRLEEGGGSLAALDGSLGTSYGPSPGRFLRTSAGGVIQSRGWLSGNGSVMPQRLDDGLLCAPLRVGGETREMILAGECLLDSPGSTARFARPEIDVNGTGVSVRWRSMGAGLWNLRLALPCRPADEPSFRNDHARRLISEPEGSGLRLEGAVYEGLPALRVLASASPGVELRINDPEDPWDMGRLRIHRGGASVIEDSFHGVDLHVESSDPGADWVELRVELMGAEAIATIDTAGIEGARGLDPWPRSWHALIGPAPEVGSGQNIEPGIGAAEALERIRARAAGGPLWHGLRGLGRWHGAATDAGEVGFESAALLHHLLMRAEGAAADPGRRAVLASERRRTAGWIQQAFWIPLSRRFRDAASLDDVRDPRYLAVTPAAILAAGLPGAPLNRAQRQRCVKLAEQRLMAAGGVRGLDPTDDGFDPGCPGRGLLWPWLFEPFTRASLLAFGPERGRQRALRQVAIEIEDAPEAWRDDGDVPVPVGDLCSPRNARAARWIRRWLAGEGTPGTP